MKYSCVNTKVGAGHRYTKTVKVHGFASPQLILPGRLQVGITQGACDARYYQVAISISLFLAESKLSITNQGTHFGPTQLSSTVSPRRLSATTKMITVLVSGVSVVFCAFVLFGLTVADTGGSERVRLVNGRNRYEGRVEVTLQSSSWTPVCQSRWNLHDANILCKELGRPGAMMSGRDNNALENDERERIYRVDCDEDIDSITQCDYEYNRWCPNAATAKCNYDGYLGCYSDDDEFPALPGGAITIDQMTIQSCLDHCRSLGMYYAGLGPPNYCYCGREGTDYGQHGYASDSCLERCEGDATQACGGDEAIAVYTTTLGACGGEVENSGTIYSPGFPGQSLQQQSCSWNISTPVGTVIELKFGFKDKHDSLFIDENIYSLDREVVLTDRTVKSCSNEVRVRFSGDETGGTFALEFNGVEQHCMTPPALEEGYREREHFDVTDFCPLQGRHLSIKCIAGYNLTSAHDTITCLENREWNDTFPKCSIISCGDPGNVDDSSRDGTSYVYQSIVIYTCHDGFTGNGIITCTANGNWTDKPICTAVDCGDPGEIAHAERYGSLFTFPHVVKYNCTEGFIGGGYIVCTELGTWTDKPECIPAGILKDSPRQVTVGLIAGVTIGVITMMAIIVVASIIVIRKRKAKNISGSSNAILNNRSYGNIVSDSENRGEGQVQPLTQKEAHSYEALHAVKEDYTKLQFQETRFMSRNALRGGMRAAIGKEAGEGLMVIGDPSVSQNDSDNEYAYAKFDDIGVKTDSVDSSQRLSQNIQRGFDGKNFLNPNHEGKTLERQQNQFLGNDAPQAEGLVVAVPEAELPKKYQAGAEGMTENIAYESASDVNGGFIDNVIYESNVDEENPYNVRHSNDFQTNRQGDSSRNHESNREVKYDGMVENIAYELTDDTEDYGDVYAEIADTGAENVDVEGGVDNILYESGTIENADDVEYYVLEGP